MLSKGNLPEIDFRLLFFISIFLRTFYWASEGKAKVDFLIQYKNEIFPVEVKSDQNIRSKSLEVYNQKYKPRVRIRYSLRNLTFDGGLLNVPLYLADQTSRLLDLCK